MSTSTFAASSPARSLTRSSPSCGPSRQEHEIFSQPSDVNYFQEDENPPRAYEILQELRDISSMAMEYFDDKIVPTLKVQLSPLRFGGSMSLSLSQYSQDYSRVSLSGKSMKYFLKRLT